MCIVPENLRVKKCCCCIPLRKGSILISFFCFLLYIGHIGYCALFCLKFDNTKHIVYSTIIITLMVSDVAVCIACVIIFWTFLDKDNLKSPLLWWETIIFGHYLVVVFQLVGLFLLTDKNNYDLLLIMADCFISSYFTIVLISYAQKLEAQNEGFSTARPNIAIIKA